ncbi:beta-lactamase/transpeptidase-like protein [Collybia nuda]|uniref:Beta-lactamase/transpeptidase-like protein n=1 Tax=Collybia nuda TaxID=64659 RepID=A0A9P5Y9U6_9AGAR|nr:beta-lactamase/transpeptidase-like protein [Collybia nuda]
MRFQDIYNALPLTICGSAVFLGACVHAQEFPSSVLTSETDTFINQVLTDWQSPGGAAVAVVRKSPQGDWIVETKGYGAATINGSKVTENTRFAIGSNSKLFDALSVGLLVNNETLSPRLSWSSKIASIVPGWGLMDPVAAKQATIIDLMSHRTGMPRHDFSYRWFDDLPSVVKKLRSLKPSAEFRDPWQYDNMMYMVLAYIPEVLAKMPFARFVKQHIFDPLGMTSTTYSFDVANASGQLADGLTRRNGVVRAYPFWSTLGGEDGNVVSGPGGVISTAVDMATWLQTLLLEGVKPGTNTSVIPTEAISKVATGITVITGAAQFPELSPVVYGGGQSRSTYQGHEFIEHDGGTLGFYSRVTRLPFDNVGVAVLTNDDDAGFIIMDIIRFRLVEVALGLKNVDWSSRFKASTSASRQSLPERPTNTTAPQVKLELLTGKYDSAGYGGFELCLMFSPSPKASKACKDLTARALTILPGALNPNVPTFLSEWNTTAVPYISFTHLNGNVFDVRGLASYPTNDPSQPYWATSSPGSAEGSFAELVVEGGRIGFGVTGVWGAGDGVPGPQGKTVRERSEAWFDKV